MTEPAVTKSICRSCLEPSLKTYPLIGQLVNVDVEVVSMLEFCTSSKMDLSDDLPKNVCVPCFRTIRIAYRFLKQFYEAQTKLIASRNENKLQQIEQQQSNNNEISEREINSDETDDILGIHNYIERSPSEDNAMTEIVNGEDNSKGNNNVFKIEDIYDNETVDEAVEEEKYCADIDFENGYVIYNDDENEDNEIKLEFINGSEENAEVEDIKYVIEENSDPVQFLSLEDVANIEVIKDESKEDQNYKLFRYLCPICEKRFCRAETFFSHVNKHNVPTIVCSRCPCQPELETLEYYRHYMECHRYDCYICGKVMTSSYGYQYHMKHHENVRNFKCPIKGCSRSFFMKHLLRKHIKSHTMKNAFSCHLCDATYNTNDSLRYHLKLHDGKKDHLCTMCGRAFYQAVHLRDHMYRHIGYKKFICDICAKGFITNGSLKKHILYCSKKHNLVKYEK